ncbi:hypothetical protein PGT21_006985 [Puccinia graminis f. sp. tritici]|uniref:Uncharacterized protein n=1 Tax=Puccinia graminis f. sp. tritici TaxID=56615 RepID=A0A5B0N2P8_PUCGR|nr:hypothetical protein PGTUg99_035544 [Puccinia graminis f. sp. tritici]KAA1094003.1 hypothetical protein PGT21_005723 [Puccinia graminis f. sp. tritici]KAA1108294.1 hypothetical protein PGT21_006985 [Puccinia graminis f. sp. tritici]
MIRGALLSSNHSLSKALPHSSLDTSRTQRRSRRQIVTFNNLKDNGRTSQPAYLIALVTSTHVGYKNPTFVTIVKSTANSGIETFPEEVASPVVMKTSRYYGSTPGNAI